MSILATYNFSPQIAEALDEAFELAGIDPGSVGEGHLDSAFRSIKTMLNSEWSNLGVRQWSVVQATQTMSVGLSSFDLPAGAIDILQAVLRRDSRDTPMNPISRSDYLDIADKFLNGRPDRYFADKRYNKITVNLWRRGENTTDVVVYNYLRQLSDTGAMSNTLDMPTRFLDAFQHGLAARLALKFNRDRYAALQVEYRGTNPNDVGGKLGDALAGDRERVDLQFTYHRRR